MEIVDLAEKTKKELLQDEETISGEISIGCGETQNMKPLCEMIIGACGDQESGCVLVWKKNLTLSPAMLSFITHIKERLAGQDNLQ